MNRSCAIAYALFTSSAMILAFPQHARSQQATKTPHTAPPGAWSKATHIATMPGKWLSDAELKALEQTKSPDDMLKAFPAAEVNLLVSLGLQTGMEPFMEAVRKPTEPVVIVDKNVSVTFRTLEKKTKNGQTLYRPIFVLQMTQAPAAGPK